MKILFLLTVLSIFFIESFASSSSSSGGKKRSKGKRRSTPSAPIVIYRDRPVSQPVSQLVSEPVSEPSPAPAPQPVVQSVIQPVVQGNPYLYGYGYQQIPTPIIITPQIHNYPPSYYGAYSSNCGACGIKGSSNGMYNFGSRSTAYASSQSN